MTVAMRGTDARRRAAVARRSGSASAGMPFSSGWIRFVCNGVRMLGWAMKLSATLRAPAMYSSTSPAYVWATAP
jgi:hypothetical protein